MKMNERKRGHKAVSESGGGYHLENDDIDSPQIGSAIKTKLNEFIYK